MDIEENGFGPDFIVITDEEGKEYEIEHLDTIEIDGVEYMAFLDRTNEDEENPEMVLFRVIEDNGEVLFASIDDDDELERVDAAFIQKWYDEEENEDEYDEEEDDD